MEVIESTKANFMKLLASPRDEASFDTLKSISTMEIGDIRDGIYIVNVDHFISGRQMKNSRRAYVLPHGKVVTLTDDSDAQVPFVELVYKNTGVYGQPRWTYVRHQKPDAKLDAKDIF